MQTSEPLGQFTSVDPGVVVIRAGQELPASDNMAILPGDRIRSTHTAMALVAIPGLMGQAPTLLQIKNGAQATLSFDESRGKQGAVVIDSEFVSGPDDVAIISEFDDQNQAAVLNDDGASSGFFGLFGGGLLAATAPVATAAAGTAVVLAAVSGSDDSSSTGTSTGGTGGNNGGGSVTPTEQGGLVGVVEGITNGLDDATASVPVLGAVVDTTTNVLEQVLAGDNQGGVLGLLTGVTDGLADGLAGTPLSLPFELLNQGLDMLTDGLHSGFDMVGAALDGTPLEPVVNLVENLLGTTESADGFGGVLGTVTGLTENLSNLLDPVPVVGDLVHVVDGVVSAIASGSLPLNASLNGLEILNGLGERLTGLG